MPRMGDLSSNGILLNLPIEYITALLCCDIIFITHCITLNPYRESAVISQLE